MNAEKREVHAPLNTEAGVRRKNELLEKNISIEVSLDVKTSAENQGMKKTGDKLEQDWPKKKWDEQKLGDCLWYFSKLGGKRGKK